MAHLYKSCQIEPGFWCIEESGVRCFPFEGDGEAMLIDAGFSTGNLKDYHAELSAGINFGYTLSKTAQAEFNSNLNSACAVIIDSCDANFSCRI